MCRPLRLLQQLEDRIVLDAAVNPAVQNNSADHPNPQADTAKTGMPAVDQIASSTDVSTAPAALPDNLNQVFHKDQNVVIIANAPADVHGGPKPTGASDTQVLVVESTLQHADQLAAAAQSGVLTVLYDGLHDTPDGILSSIESALGGKKAESIASRDTRPWRRPIPSRRPIYCQP